MTQVMLYTQFIINVHQRFHGMNVINYSSYLLASFFQNGCFNFDNGHGDIKSIRFTKVFTNILMIYLARKLLPAWKSLLLNDLGIKKCLRRENKTFWGCKLIRKINLFINWICGNGQWQKLLEKCCYLHASICILFIHNL